MATRTAAQSAAEDRSAWARLQRARPDVEWHKASLRSADFTGDGTATRVMVGVDDAGATWIGLVRPTREGPLNPAVFGVALSVGLSFEKLDSEQDWLVDGAFALAGCRPRRGMHLLRVVDEAAGTVSLMYWNAEERCFSRHEHAAARVAGPEPFEDLDLTG